MIKKATLLVVEIIQRQLVNNTKNFYYRNYLIVYFLLLLNVPLLSQRISDDYSMFEEDLNPQQVKSKKIKQIIVKAFRPQGGIPWLCQQEIYDPEGRRLERNTYSSNGEWTSVTQYYYDSLNGKLREIIYKNAKELYILKNFKFNKENKIRKYNVYDKKKCLARIFNKYKSGYIIQQRFEIFHQHTLVLVQGGSRVGPSYTGGINWRTFWLNYAYYKDKKLKYGKGKKSFHTSQEDYIIDDRGNLKEYICYEGGIVQKRYSYTLKEDGSILEKKKCWPQTDNISYNYSYIYYDNK